MRTTVIIAVNVRTVKNPVIGLFDRRAARTSLLQWREKFARSDPRAFSEANTQVNRGLGEVLAELCTVVADLRVGLYWPIRAEPDWREHAATWRAAGMQLLLPVTRPGEALRFRRFQAASRLVADRFGILSPSHGPFWAPDVVIAPCVGFDDQGWRLGFGGGFYDRTLAVHRVPIIGVAFEQQKIRLEVQPHDRPLDALVTQAGVRWWARPAPVVRGP